MCSVQSLPVKSVLGVPLEHSFDTFLSRVINVDCRWKVLVFDESDHGGEGLGRHRISLLYVLLARRRVLQSLSTANLGSIELIPARLVQPLAVLTVRVPELSRHHRGVVFGIGDSCSGDCLLCCRRSTITTLRSVADVLATPLESQVLLVRLRMGEGVFLRSSHVVRVGRDRS